MKSLFGKPCSFFFAFGNVDSFDLEDDWPGAVVAAGNHHAVIVCPALHNGAALKSSVHIPADSIPFFTAELTVHQMIEVILLWRSFEQKSISYIEEGARARIWISQVLLLIVSEALKYL